MVLRFLVEKEFKQIARNPVMVSLIIFFPVVVLLLLPWAVNFDVKNVQVAVVNHSQGPLSARLIEQLKASPAFDSIHIIPSYSEAFDRVLTNRVGIIVCIPPNFDRDLQQSKHPDLYVAASAVDGTKALLANNYLIANILQFSQSLRGENSTLSGSSPLHLVTNYRYNPTSDFKTYMLPAFIVILLTLICGILPALNIVQEKESGTIQQLNVTPVRKMVLILSKMIPYWIIGLLILGVSVLILHWVYHLYPLGSLWVLLLFSVVFIIAVTGMGIVVSNYSSTLQQAMLLVMFFVLIFLLMSGLFTQVEGMPFWGRVIAYLNPLTYYIESLRLLYLKGAYLSDMLLNLAVLLVFSVVINFWAVFSYSKVS